MTEEKSLKDNLAEISEKLDQLAKEKKVKNFSYICITATYIQELWKMF